MYDPSLGLSCSISLRYSNCYISLHRYIFVILYERTMEKVKVKGYIKRC